MATATVATDPDLSLKKLQLIVQQQEGIFGPLKQFKAGVLSNILEFEVTAIPRHRAILKTSGQVEPAATKGYVLLCHGDCFIAGKKTHVAAFRAEKN